MGRTTVNLVGNCVATVVIARWENAFDYDKMKRFISDCDKEDKELEMYVDEETGKAYFEEGTSFKKIEKPLVSLKRFKRVPIVEIKDSAKGRAVVVEHDGKYYSFNFNSGVYIEKLNKFIPNQAKLAKAKAKHFTIFIDEFIL